MDIDFKGLPVAQMENLRMTGPELFQFLISRPNVYKVFVESKRCQDIYYKINGYCLAEKHKFFFRNKIKTTTCIVNVGACNLAMRDELIPVFNFI